MATGCLSIPNLPDFEGLDRFEGDWYHTADWPREGVDFTGRRVGVVGTGSSGVQSIPVIAGQAAHLTVFQRTANFSIPAWNAPLEPHAIERWKSGYPALRSKARVSPVGDVFDVPDKGVLEVPPEERRQRFEAGWRQGSFGFLSTFKDLLTNQAASDIAAEFVCQKIRATVKDPAVAELLCPKDLPIGTKRLCVDTNYYETFNRENVSLVDISAAPIEAITPKGLKAGGVQYELDAIVFATGYDAMTGALLRIDIRGRDGASLRRKWAEGPRTYLGLAIAGFPNLFTVTGPGSPSVISNMMVSIEQHIDWIADCIGYLQERGFETIEATQDAEDRWTRHVGEVADGTLFPKGRSWYIGVNIPGKPRVCYPYLGGVGAYRKICDDVAAKAYEGFVLTEAPLRPGVEQSAVSQRRATP
jgi:cyclohexanone monooxygenase